MSLLFMNDNPINYSQRINYFITKAFNLLDQQINVGDYICVSTEEGEFGLGTGTIKRLSLETVVVGCSDKISQPLGAKRGAMLRVFVEDSELCVPSPPLLPTSFPTSSPPSSLRPLLPPPPPPLPSPLQL